MTNLAATEMTQNVTRDRFLDGKIEILQPSGEGHRSGLDAILLAATLPADSVGNLADLGSGSGVAGIAAIALRPKLRVLLVENNPLMAELASQSSNLAKNSALATRIKVLEADVTLTGSSRQKAGLLACSFEKVMMNPPYLDAATNRRSSDKTKADAHMMGLGGLDAWMRTATCILKPGGMLTMIYRSQSIGQIIAATQGRFGDLQIMPVYPKADKPAKLLLIRAVKGSRAPVTFVPAVVIHNEDGSFTSKAAAVLSGDDFLFQGF
jgi:tRNA1(Val) A37 N6-methylase TrmN6